MNSYTPKASMPDSYELAMPFGTFRLSLNEQEADNTRYEDDNEHAVIRGKRITRDQLEQLFAELRKREDEDSVRVLTANEARAKALAAKAQSAQEQRALKAQATRQKLTARIAWAEGEISRAQLQLEIATRRAENEIARLNGIKANAELELLGL